tara:strand:- start:6834 stop:7592 length:759 start_codon:yes stop_codon:yes gene_type:complete
LSLNFRLIGRLDIKSNKVVRTYQKEGFKFLDEPLNYAERLYEDKVDEIIFDDIVASLYERNSLSSEITKLSKKIFIPFIVGGGIRNISDASFAFERGADKVFVNTAAIKNVEVISNISKKFGRQSIALSVQAKRNENKWIAYYDNGRENSGLEVKELINRAQQSGVGEIILQSIDNQGTKKGFDYNLIEDVLNVVTVPLIVSGGFGKLEHLDKLVKITSGKLSGISFANIFLEEIITIKQLNDHCIKLGLLR